MPLHEQTTLVSIPELPRSLVYAVQDWHDWKYPTSRRPVTLKDLCKLSAHDLMENLNPQNGIPPYVGPAKLQKVRDVLAKNDMALRYDPEPDHVRDVRDDVKIIDKLNAAQTAIAVALREMTR